MNKMNKWMENMRNTRFKLKEWINMLIWINQPNSDILKRKEEVDHNISVFCSIDVHEFGSFGIMETFQIHGYFVKPHSQSIYQTILWSFQFYSSNHIFGWFHYMWTHNFVNSISLLHCTNFKRLQSYIYLICPIGALWTFAVDFPSTYSEPSVSNIPSLSRKNTSQPSDTLNLFSKPTPINRFPYPPRSLPNWVPILSFS